MMLVFFRMPKTVVTFLRGLRRGEKRKEKFSTVFSVQPIDKSRFGRENPRKSKEIQGP